MFWGISLESGKRYSQTVEKSFHISMAALNATSGDKGSVTIMVEVEKACYPLCTLISGKIPQQTLDYFFTEGEEVLFYTEGDNLEVHLTGYLADDPDPVEYSSDNQSEESASNASESEEEANSIKNLLAEIDGLNEDNDGDVNTWLPRSARKKLQKNEDTKGTSSQLFSLCGDDSEESEDMEWQPGSKQKKNDTSNKIKKNSNNDKAELDMNDTPKKDDKSLSKSKKKAPKDSTKVKQDDNGESSARNVCQEEKSPVDDNKNSLKPSNTAQDEHHHDKKHLPGGVVADDLAKGTGKKAKKSRQASVHHKGSWKKTKKNVDECLSGEG